jgi:two-component system, OmpR family, response regulator ArlR
VNIRPEALFQQKKANILKLEVILMRILYAEDEPALSDAVKDILEYHKYSVDVVDNGGDALTYAATQHYDVLILDIMMPVMDGLEVLKHLREKRIGTPVLLLTAKGTVEDKIRGLDEGADDYLAKPFVMKELLARVRALLRRRETFMPDQLRVGNLILDQKQAVLCCGDQTLPLSKLEYQLLELFMTHPGMSFSAAHLLDQVWGINSEADVNVVWVYISYLRKKLTGLHANVVIRCKHGIGYSLEESE